MLQCCIVRTLGPETQSPNPSGSIESESNAAACGVQSRQMSRPQERHQKATTQRVSTACGDRKGGRGARAGRLDGLAGCMALKGFGLLAKTNPKRTPTVPHPERPASGVKPPQTRILDITQPRTPRVSRVCPLLVYQGSCLSLKDYNSHVK